MRILEISAYYHDSAAALIEDGRIVTATQKEPFARKKYDSRFSNHAICDCLTEAGIVLTDIYNVMSYDKPFLNSEQLSETYVAYAPGGFQSFKIAVPIWLQGKLFQRSLLRKKLRRYKSKFKWDEQLLFAQHQLSDAASVCFHSPSEEAVVFTIDGVGERETTSVAIGRDNSLDIIKKIHFRHSIGFLYSAFTYYTRFKVNSGGYKVMDLALYGVSQYKDLAMEHIVDLKEDGSFRLDMSYFNYCTGLTKTNDKLHKLLDRLPGTPEDRLEQFYMDNATSVQAASEEIILFITRVMSRKTGIQNLCLAVGALLN